MQHPLQKYKHHPGREVDSSAFNGGPIQKSFQWDIGEDNFRGIYCLECSAVDWQERMLILID
jgi:hypothetical protein